MPADSFTERVAESLPRLPGEDGDLAYDDLRLEILEVRRAANRGWPGETSLADVSEVELAVRIEGREGYIALMGGLPTLYLDGEVEYSDLADLATEIWTAFNSALIEHALEELGDAARSSLQEAVTTWFTDGSGSHT